MGGWWGVPDLSPHSSAVLEEPGLLPEGRFGTPGPELPQVMAAIPSDLGEKGRPPDGATGAGKQRGSTQGHAACDQTGARMYAYIKHTYMHKHPALAD